MCGSKQQSDDQEKPCHLELLTEVVEFEIYSNRVVDVYELRTSVFRPSGTCYLRIYLSAGRVLFENISGISQSCVNNAFKFSRTSFYSRTSTWIYQWAT